MLSKDFFNLGARGLAISVLSTQMFEMILYQQFARRIIGIKFWNARYWNFLFLTMLLVAFYALQIEICIQGTLWSVLLGVGLTLASYLFLIGNKGLRKEHLEQLNGLVNLRHLSRYVKKELTINREMSKYKKALVTGGAGFVGSHLVEALVKSGVYTISVDNYFAGKEENLAHLKQYKSFSGRNVMFLTLSVWMNCSRALMLFSSSSFKKTILPE